MRRDFLLFMVSLEMASAACSIGDHELVTDTPDGGSRSGARDAGVHDGGRRVPEDAEADRTSSRREAGEDAGGIDARVDDAPATEGGGGPVMAEAGCSDAETACGDGGACVDEQMDPKNCGACGHDCTLAPHVDPQMTTCSKGQCVYACAPGFADDCPDDAGAGCTTSLSTPANCGKCGHTCTGASALCTASSVDAGAAACTATCAAGTALCNGSCVNDQTDPNACGSTCAVCPYVCTAGVCAGSCVPGATDCNGSQPQLCNSNGVWESKGSACATCYACSPATSTCVPSTGTACNDGNACTQTDTCENGTCVGTNPVTCTAADLCHVAGTCNSATGTCSTPLASGASCTTGESCVAWYPDCDEDGYGRAVAPSYSCVAPIGPSGCPSYVTNNSDCCDSDPEAHPGQTAYFTTPDACGSTTQSTTPYDYNCNGVDDVQSNGPTDCEIFTCTVSGSSCLMGPLPADCSGDPSDFDQAACGATWYGSTTNCEYVGPPAGPFCQMGGGSGAGGTQACH